MSIKGLTETRRLPRLGKIRLGIKKRSPRTGGEYPVATDYFVCPPEVQEIYSKKPKCLDVIIPLEDEEIWASQYYRQYSRSRGLVCKGDGETCRRMVDVATGAVAGRDTREVAWQEGIPCKGRQCPDYQASSCQEVMNLQFLLPKVPGLGIWQIDTGSIHSIMNINNCATMIRAMCGRVSWIPLTLTLEPTEVVNPDDGKKKMVYCMHLRYERSAESLLLDSEKPRLQVLLGAPHDEEAPDDRLLGSRTPEKKEELLDRGADIVDELWPEDDTTPTKPPAESSVTPKPAETTPAVTATKEEGSKGEPPPMPKGFINLPWLKEQLTALQAKKLKMWANETVVNYINSVYRVKGQTVDEVVPLLNKEQAVEFTKRIEDAMKMA